MKSANSYVATVNSDGSIVNTALIEGYVAANIDASSPAYYGFTDADGNWYIMRETTLGAVRTYEFVKGTSDYSTNWTGRAGLSYGTYSAVF